MTSAPKQQPVTESGEELPDPPPEIGDATEIQEDDEGQELLEEVRRRYLLGRFWLSAKGFWSRNGSKLAWPLSIGLLVLILINLAIQYGINVWNRQIFDLLEKKDAATVFHLIALFIPLAASGVVINVISVYTRMTIQRRWRAWLNDRARRALAQDGRYYQLNLVSGDHKNPGIPHRRRCAHRNRIAGRFCDRGHSGLPVSRRPSLLCCGPSAGLAQSRLAASTSPYRAFLVFAAVLYAVIASRLDGAYRPSLRAGRRRPRTKPKPSFGMCSPGCARTAKASR